ncbi:LysR family transcriptional regulator [Falsiroseomonas sp. HW251]|uniref:LysR family transcriptional regulator n=1 Tax=Falsiroseomonas sp. HW251 TaxID=3390998 RepID=UPI003D31D927
MDTETLRIFAEVARLGSFAAVARARETEPSTISRAVAALEAGIGVPLLQRSTRRLALTEAGHAYLARAARVIEELDRAAEDATATTGGPAGTLRLTASVAFGQRCVVPLLPSLRAAHPALRLELLLRDGVLDLVAERVDLAIRLAPRVSGDVVAARLMPTRYRVVASPAYLRDAPPLAEPSDLARHRCLLSALPDYRARWRFRRGSAAVTAVEVAGDLATTNALALRDCALAGMGPALLADWLVGADLAAGRLVDLLPNWRAAATEFETAAWLVYPTRAFLPAKVRAVIDFLRRHLPAAAGAA